MRRHPYPFGRHYLAVLDEITAQVAECENADDLARVRRWVSSFCQDVQALADEAQLPDEDEREVA